MREKKDIRPHKDFIAAYPGEFSDSFWRVGKYHINIREKSWSGAVLIVCNEDLCVYQSLSPTIKYDIQDPMLWELVVRGVDKIEEWEKLGEEVNGKNE